MSLFYTKQTEPQLKEANVYAVVIIGFILILGGIIGGLMAGIPPYRVWSRTLGGQALLREQEYAKQVLIEQAKAEKDSAILLADAEVSRAKGIAQSMIVISEQLEKNPNYLQYLAIQAQVKMAESPNHTTIYIPVGANGIPLIKEIDQ